DLDHEVDQGFGIDRHQLRYPVVEVRDTQATHGIGRGIQVLQNIERFAAIGTRHLVTVQLERRVFTHELRIDQLIVYHLRVFEHRRHRLLITEAIREGHGPTGPTVILLRLRRCIEVEPALYTLLTFADYQQGLLAVEVGQRSGLAG